MAKDESSRMSRDELEAWEKMLIRATIAEHINQCPVQERVRKLEVGAAKMTGWLAGAGAVGGVVVALGNWALSVFSK